MTITGTANIASALTEMARLRPFAMAVACPSGRDRSGRVAYSFQTFRQLDRESDILARGLTAVGIGRGVRTALLVRPGHEFFALTFALFKAGAVPVLIDPGIGLKNMGKCLNDARPGAFVGIPEAQAARRVLGWGKPWVKVAVSVRPVAPRRRVAPDLTHPLSLSLAQVRQAGLFEGDTPFPAVEPITDTTDAILFTSGSTGPPKGVVYTHAILNAQVNLLRDLYGIEPGEIDLCTFPLFALFAPALGMTSVVPVMDPTRPARVDPVKIVDAVETFGVTNLFGSPALLKRVGDYGASRGIKLSSLRRVISAGAPVAARVLENVAAMLAPGVQVFTPYGATEALPVCSIGSDEILGETRHVTDSGGGVCVGHPVIGMSIALIRVTSDRLTDWSDDLLVPTGSVGEIVVRGPVVTTHYHDNPSATAMAIIPAPCGPDGMIWRRMGDLGSFDARGRLWFQGRKAHRVVTAEGPLDTIPTEAVFNTHPLVARTALVGVGRPDRARPVLCVELKPGVPKRVQSRIRTELLEIGRRFPHTKQIDEVLFHRSFPVDVRHNAKIFRERLAVWAARRVR